MREHLLAELSKRKPGHKGKTWEAQRLADFLRQIEPKVRPCTTSPPPVSPRPCTTSPPPVSPRPAPRAPAHPGRGTRHV